MLANLPTDLGHAVRLLLKNPLFAVVSVVSLAVGIAATTTVFGLTDALLLQPSPGVREPEALVEIARTTNGSGYGTLSYPAFEHLRENTQSFEALAATATEASPLSLRTDEGSERVFGTLVSGSYFEVVKVRPALGRFFLPDEDAAPDARPVAVLSHRLWQERFASDPRVLERPVRLNDTPFTVIGVAEAGFEGTTFLGTDLWVPMAMAGTVRGQDAAKLLGDPGNTWHRAVGRLKPDVTVEQARAELNTLFDAYKSDTPAVPETHGILVAPGARVPYPVRTPFRLFMVLLFVLTGGLLAVACSNVAGMLLARATTRQNEMAIRAAMGASRGRLVGQMLVETAVLFLAAAIVAVPATLWLTSALQAFLPSLPVPVHLELAIGWRAAMFAAGVALLTGLVFGLTPARQALRSNLSPMLHGRHSTDSRQRLRIRHALVAAQVALSLALAITAGLLVRTLQTAAHMDTGYQTANVDIVSLDTSVLSANRAEAVRLMGRIRDRIENLGGVQSVGHALRIPLLSGSFAAGGIRIPGASDAVHARLNEDGWDVVSPGYFTVVGLPILEGRAFTRDDEEGKPLVAVVNETFARVAWPGLSPIGQWFWQVTDEDKNGRPIEVVGVAKDAKYQTLGEAPRAFVYVPFTQHPQRHVELFVKHAAEQSMAADLRVAVASVEPRLPVISIQSFDDATAVALLPQRLAAWIAGAAGTVALFLAALGLYGLAAFLVAQRRREIAIRMALGASRRHVQSIVFTQAARLALVGGAAGIALAMGAALLVERLNLLVGVQAIDPISLAVAAAVMSAALFAASYVPARRAAAADAAEALRPE